MAEPGRASVSDEVGHLLRRTATALRTAGDRWDSRAVLVGTTVGYLLLYLVTVGDLSLVTRGGELTVRFVDDPTLAFKSAGFLRFEAIAVIGIAGVTYLLSPLNLVVAGILAVLVGANLSLTYLGFVQPRACGLETSAGVMAGIPALLTGAACCGPTLLLVLGVQASATLITGFQVLVPLAFVLLVGSLLMIGQQVDPTLL